MDYYSYYTNRAMYCVPALLQHNWWSQIKKIKNFQLRLRPPSLSHFGHSSAPLPGRKHHNSTWHRYGASFCDAPRTLIHHLARLWPLLGLSTLSRMSLLARPQIFFHLSAWLGTLLCLLALPRTLLCLLTLLRMLLHLSALLRTSLLSPTLLCMLLNVWSIFFLHLASWRMLLPCGLTVDIPLPSCFTKRVTYNYPT